ncbi:MMPL family transporter [Rothia sp. P6271]|uniref:MMPL family transporter n=1 Tax=unclassified Rothia (in: high G+C Gram-positive bacteria) TaxID=2689056 RepID=UPI003ACCF275
MSPKHFSSSQATTPWWRLALMAVLIVFWAALTVIGGSLFGRISDLAINAPQPILASSVESSHVAQERGEFYVKDYTPAIIVFSSGKPFQDIDYAYLEGIPQYLRDQGLDIKNLHSLEYSKDQEVAKITIPIAKDQDLRRSIHKIQGAIANPPGNIQGYVTGPAAFTVDLSDSLESMNITFMMYAVAVVLILLAIIFRSLLVSLTVMISTVAALCASLLTLWVLADHGVIYIQAPTQGTLLVLVFTASMTYSLLYLWRYCEERKRHRSLARAAQQAFSRTWRPILIAGGTSTIALLCLSFSQTQATKALGITGSIGMLFATLASLSFLQAMLALLTRFSFLPPKTPQRPTLMGKPQRLREKLIQQIHHAPRKMWLAVALPILILSTLAISFPSMGTAENQKVTGTSQARIGQEIYQNHFEMPMTPLAQVIVSEKDLKKTVETLTSVQGVESITSPSRTSTTGQVLLSENGKIKEHISSEPAPYVSHKKVFLNVYLHYFADTPEALASVKEIRQKLRNNIDTTAVVGGEIAKELDVKISAQQDKQMIIPLMLAVMFLVLFITLRAVVPALLMVVITAISYAASLGLSSPLCQLLWSGAGADPNVSLYGFIVLMVLSLSYNVFFFMRVREETIRHGWDEGNRNALRMMIPVLLSSGVILLSVFIYLLAISLTFLAQLACILSCAVAIQALLIHMILIPASYVELGEKLWWPAKTPELE